MEAIRFDPNSHLDEVNGWCQAWGIQKFPDGWLPTVGYIVPGILCAWLYVSDSDIAWVENLISNKEATQGNVDAASILILDSLLNAAKECGTKWVRATSNNKSVISRAKERGFSIVSVPSYEMIKNV